jgi:hypothetical protein
MDKNPEKRPTNSPGATDDELMALVAGTLDEEDFVRVAKAVKNDIALRIEFARLEQIRSGLARRVQTEKSPAEIDTFTEKVLQQLSGKNRVQTKKPSLWAGWFDRFFTPGSARLAFGLVAAQIIGIVWLANSALPVNIGEQGTADFRSTGSGITPHGATSEVRIFSVTFSPDTTESSMRGLLLELEAQIVAGPSQLGQYRISVARNRSQLVLLKLRESVFVEQVTEIARDAPKNINSGIK